MYFSERFFVFENIWNQGFVKDVHKLTLTLLPGCTKLLLQTAFMDNLVFILKAHSTWKLKCANLHWQLSSKNNLKLWFSWILCYESKLFQHESTTGHFRERERERERERAGILKLVYHSTDCWVPCKTFKPDFHPVGFQSMLQTTFLVIFY